MVKAFKWTKKTRDVLSRSPSQVISAFHCLEIVHKSVSIDFITRQLILPTEIDFTSDV